MWWMRPCLTIAMCQFLVFIKKCLKCPVAVMRLIILLVTSTVIHYKLKSNTNAITANDHDVDHLPPCRPCACLLPSYHLSLKEKQIVP